MTLNNGSQKYVHFMTSFFFILLFLTFALWNLHDLIYDYIISNNNTTYIRVFNRNKVSDITMGKLWFFTIWTSHWYCFLHSNNKKKLSKVLCPLYHRVENMLHTIGVLILKSCFQRSSYLLPLFYNTAIIRNYCIICCT